MFAHRLPVFIFWSPKVPLWIGLWITVPINVTHAGKPVLNFDFARLTECYESSSLEITNVYDDEKLVELKLRVSVHLLAGDISDVEELRIEVKDCENKMRVHSFAPNTRLQSVYSKDIQVTKTAESGKQIGAALGGAIPIPAGDLVAQVSPSLSGGLSERETITEVQQRVAPQQAVVASGTINEEHGVFFKLRSSPQTSLEGVHELTVRFLVPLKWRGDSMRVCCYAMGHEKMLWMEQEKTWAQKCAPVALYLAGDVEARQMARKHIIKSAL
tara:strand:- start:661 stop:1476 length:816 start_codon:yes stop_codon:yes gene_type:complete